MLLCLTDTPDPISHELCQHSVHRAKVTVWCAVSSHGIIGPYCFENAEGLTVTVNAEWYKVTFLHIELHPCQQGMLWFLQEMLRVMTAFSL
jgi:hypothetical protein